MANLVYRKSTLPNTNAITVFKGSPLTNDELDNNLFGIDAEVQTKAPINNAEFTGSTTIPNIIATGGTINNTSIGATTPLTGAFTTLSSTGNAAINGGSITTTATTFNLVNATATTLNLGGAATAITVGAVTGTTTVRNNLGVGGSVAVNTDRFTVAANGNTVVAGTLGVSGVTTLAAVNATTGSFSNQITSTLATGTPPFAVASTTIVTSLNADRVDDFNADQANTASTIVVRNSSKNININNVVMSGSTGTTTLQPSATASGILTLPAATDTLVGKATADTFTNKTINLALASNNTLTGTLAEFNNALSGADFVSIAGVETLTSKTLTSPVINTATISGGTIDNAPIGATTRAAGSFTTLNANSTLVVTGATTLNSTLTVSSTTNLSALNVSGNVAVSADRFTVASGTGNTVVAGTLGVVSDVSFGPLATPKFTVAGTTGNTSIYGTLGVSGTLGVTGVTTLSSNLIATTGSFSGQVTSTVADGTPPFAVASTTIVTSLNADRVDDFNADQANTASTIVVRDASKNIFFSKAVFSATSGITTTTLQPSATTSVTLTLPTTTDTLVGRDTGDTLTNKTLTSPTINGGTHSAITTLGIRDTSAAFDVTLAATSSTALTAGRTLTLDMVNAARTVKLAGNISLAGNFTTSGAFGITLTATALTSVTLPTTGTLATVGGTETLTNKTLTSPAINTATIVGGTINNTVIGGTTAAAGSFTTLSSSGEVSGLTLKSTATTGAPLTVSSATLVANLNADSVDGINFTAVNTNGVLGTDQRGGVAYALDASNITYVAPGTSGYILKSTGLNSAPIWVASTAVPAGNSLTAENILGGTAGSVLYQSAVDNTAKLAIGAANTILTSSGTLPQWSNSLTLAGTITHGGLTPSAGTNIDQIYTVTDSLTLNTTGWFDTSVNSTELTTGSYMVQVNTGNEYYTGIMSWYSSDITSAVTDEIILHRASAGTLAEINSGNLFLRVERTDNNASPDMTVQISSSVVRATANYTYKFRRMM